MNRVNWMQVGIFTVIVLLIFLVGASLLGGTGGYGYGMMGPGMGPGGMMGGWGFAPSGWLGMSLMWLVPLGFLTLLVAGIVWLVRAAGGPSHAVPQASAATGACPGCGRPTQVGWQHCPYCGESLV